MKNLHVLFLLLICLAGVACKNNEQSAPAEVQVKETEGTLKALISEYPDSLMLVQKLIELYRDSADFDKAIQLTDEQIERDSGNAYLWNMKAILHFENSDTAKASRALEHAVNIYPLPEYLVALGTVYAETRNPKALVIADSLVGDNNAKYADDAYFIRGLYHTYRGEKNQAIMFFDSTLSLDFTYMYAYREKAIALYELGKYNAAVTVLNRAVTVQNNFDEGHYWLGRSYEKLGMPGKAMESYQHALLYDKNYIEAKEALQRMQSEITK